jgi:acylphosphatase
VSNRVIRHIVVRGHCAGRWLSRFVEDEAHQRGLQGWVRNAVMAQVRPCSLSAAES